jgi:hypothetical protein
MTSLSKAKQKIDKCDYFAVLKMLVDLFKLKYDG